MSRYLLLLILNIPFIGLGVLNATINYKLKKSTWRSFIFRLAFWLLVLVGLFMAEPLYNFLFNNKLTDTEPLSLFDVIQITAIVILLYFVNRSRARIEELERRLQDLHQEISIRISKLNKDK